MSIFLIIFDMRKMEIIERAGSVPMWGMMHFTPFDLAQGTECVKELDSSSGAGMTDVIQDL